MLHNRVRAPESSDSCNCQRRSFLKRNFTLSIIIPFLIELPSFVVLCPSWKWKVASSKPIKFEIIHISYQNCFLIVHNIQYFVIQVTLLRAKTEVNVIYFSMQRVGLEALLHQLCLDLAITGTFEITLLNILAATWNLLKLFIQFEAASCTHHDYCEHLSKFCLKLSSWCGQYILLSCRFVSFSSLK